MTPTLSTLVITNRPQFVEWWTWNIMKQSQRPDEVLIATNLEGSKEDLDAFEDVIHHCLNKIRRVKVLKCPKSTSLGELRQSVLATSKGKIINYVDDDDWYHPWLFADFVRGIQEKKMKMLGAPGHRRLFLESLLLFELVELIDLVHLPFCAIEGDLARSIQFAPISLNEDIYWLKTISSFIQHKRAATEIHFPIMCIIHANNTWNSPDKLMHELAIEETASALPEKAPWGVPKDEWVTTHKKLATLREALGLKKPERVNNIHAI